jgi:hypothetical protein
LGQEQSLKEGSLNNSNTTLSKDSIDRTRLFKLSELNTISKLGIGNSILNFNLIHCYNFNSHLSAGLGVGLNAIIELGDADDLIPFKNGVYCRLRDFFLPVYLDFRYNARSKSRTNFLSFFEIGYAAYLGGKANDSTYTSAYAGYTGFGNKYTNGRLDYYNAFKPIAGGIFMTSGIGLRKVLSKGLWFVGDFGLIFQKYSAHEFHSDNYNGIPNLSQSPNQMAIQPIGLIYFAIALNCGVIFCPNNIIKNCRNFRKRSM